MPGLELDVSRLKNGGYVCSTVNESERLGAEDAPAVSVLSELNDRFFGGMGGADRDFGGGDARLISGVFKICSDRSARRGGGRRIFRFTAGPSSTTQSFRSMSEVLRPRLGGEGDGECEKDL
jgi:hypothetical protein